MNYVNFDKVATVYDKSRIIPNKIAEEFKQDIEKFLQKSFNQNITNVLAIGIGTGRLESILSECKNIHLFGVDISKPMLMELNNKKTSYKIYTSISDALSLPFKKKFHLLIGVHLSHLISDMDQFIRECTRIGENLVLGAAYTESYNHPLYQAYSSLAEEYGWKKRDQGLYSDDLASILEKDGYQISRKEFSMPFVLTNEEIYLNLRHRYFSAYWTISEKIHHKVTKVLENHILEGKYETKGNYHTHAYLRLFYIKLE